MHKKGEYSLETATFDAMFPHNVDQQSHRGASILCSLRLLHAGIKDGQKLCIEEMVTMSRIAKGWQSILLGSQ
jgi:hypothetical protein